MSWWLGVLRGVGLHAFGDVLLHAFLSFCVFFCSIRLCSVRRRLVTTSLCVGSLLGARFNVWCMQADGCREVQGKLRELSKILWRMPAGMCLRLGLCVVCVRVCVCVCGACLQGCACVCAPTWSVYVCVWYVPFVFFILIFIFYMWLCVGCRLVLFACVCLLELACVHGWANERMVAFAFVCVCGCLASACGLCLLVCSFLLVFACDRLCSQVDER